MRTSILAVVTVLSAQALALAAPPTPVFKKVVLEYKFYAESAYYADFNRDGKLDVVAGPFWYEGPDFQKKHEICEPVVCDPLRYSHYFQTFTADFNGDGWPDVLYLPFGAFWYENPGDKGGPWKKHPAARGPGNESIMWGDVNGDGRPELVHEAQGYLGYSTWDPAKPDQPWVFHRVSDKLGEKHNGHGLGFGDLNGDGRVDFLQSAGWWEQPAKIEEGEPWIWHPFPFAKMAAQMFVYDVDGDGLNDVVTTINCHEYGLVWWKQVRDEKGEITFHENVILPRKPDRKSNVLRISQLHALDLVDINGDGLKDIVTGKRWWAHGPGGDAEPMAAAVLYWFELKHDKEKGVEFIPHEIDNDSGVGTQVTAVDLNGDGIPDVIVANKKGSFIHLSQPAKD